MGVEVIVFVYGLIFGSFLNVVIYRMHELETIVNSRSHCMKCKKILNWYDLVPLLSFLLLRGKCRNCKEEISLQYPLVELSTAVLLTLTYIFASGRGVSTGWLVADTIVYSLLIGSLIVIFMSDLKEYIIPDEIVWPSIGLALVYLGVRGWMFDGVWGVEKLLLGVVVVAGVPALISVPSKGKWMGYGDITLGVLLGLIVGYPLVILSMMLAFILGGITGVVLLVMKAKKMSSAVPFGPFLITGAIVALFWGQRIIDWYLGYYFYY